MKHTLISLLLVASVASPSFAQSISADDPQGIVKLLQNSGYRASLTKDGVGDPLIKSATAGSNYSIFFYGCTDGKACDSVQFAAAFDMDNVLPLSLANDWNSANRYGKAYIDDEGDPFIEMDISLSGGGLSAAGFQEVLVLWDQLLGDFQTHINW